MKRHLMIIAAIVFATLAANAQFYGTGNQKVGSGNSKRSFSSSQTVEKSSSQSSSSDWDCEAIGIDYHASFDFADKGSFGLTAYGFNGSNKHVGGAFQWNHIYSLASEKFVECLEYRLGPNFYQVLSSNVVLFAPLCLTMSTIPDSEKIYWGATFTPSLGLKLGKLFLSAGWNLTYNFSAKQDQFNSETFNISLCLTN